MPDEPSSEASTWYREAAGNPERRLFNESARIYDEVRPTYPPQAFDDLLDYVRVDRPHVLEIGPGTGQATLSLLERGCRVTAVELGPDLAQMLREKVQTFPDAEVIAGLFEDAELPEQAFDIVAAATAYHWIEQPRGLNRIARLLKPAGVLAIIAVNQIKGEQSPDFFEVCQPIYQKYDPSDAPPPLPGPDVVPEDYNDLARDTRFSDVALRRYRWDQTYTTVRYAKLLNTYSGMIAMQADARAGLVRELCALIDSDFGGSIVRPLVVTLTMARLSQETPQNALVPL